MKTKEKGGHKWNIEQKPIKNFFLGGQKEGRQLKKRISGNPTLNQPKKII
jgi:hypothetical protein